MKFILSVSFFLFMVTLNAQEVGADTIPYKVERYEVKKQMKVSALAEKLKLDVNIILKLNKFRSVNSSVVKGQRVKIPIYPKAVKVKSESKQKKPKANKKELKKSEGKNKTIPPIVTEATNDSIFTAKTNDFEKDKVRLIMIEATLQLNEAIMEGVKASLDSLDVKPDTSSNNNDINAKNRQMRLSRDRVVLMPYILHVQDSLSKEIIALKNEKTAIEYRINPPKVSIDTVVSDNEMVIYEVTTYPDDREAERKLLKVITISSSKEKQVATTKKTGKKSHEVKDNIVVYNTPTYPKSEDDVIPNENKNDANKWEPARALLPLPNLKNDTAVALKITIPNSTDTYVIKPIIKTSPILSQNEAATKKRPNQILNGADSVKRIKAEFFLKRAQKSMSVKDYSNAETYLKKSVGLYPKYYDAWFATAQVHDLTNAHQQALKDYQTCYQIDSTQAQLYYSIGTSYMKLRQKTEAMHYFNKALMLKDDDIPSLMARAEILADWKNYRAALTDYDQVLKIDRLYHYAYKTRGQVELLINDFTSAMDDFTRFLIFEPSDPSAFYYRGLAKIGDKDLLDGCMDLSTSAGMGYAAAQKAIKKSCQ